MTLFWGKILIENFGQKVIIVSLLKNSSNHHHQKNFRHTVFFFSSIFNGFLINFRFGKYKIFVNIFYLDKAEEVAA